MEVKEITVLKARMLDNKIIEKGKQVLPAYLAEQLLNAGAAMEVAKPEAPKKEEKQAPKKTNSKPKK